MRKPLIQCADCVLQVQRVCHDEETVFQFGRHLGNGLLSGEDAKLRRGQQRFAEVGKERDDARVHGCAAREDQPRLRPVAPTDVARIAVRQDEHGVIVAGQKTALRGFGVRLVDGNGGGEILLGDQIEHHGALFRVVFLHDGDPRECVAAFAALRQRGDGGGAEAAEQHGKHQQHRQRTPTNSEIPSEHGSPCSEGMGCTVH